MVRLAAALLIALFMSLHAWIDQSLSQINQNYQEPDTSVSVSTPEPTSKYDQYVGLFLTGGRDELDYVTVQFRDKTPYQYIEDGAVALFRSIERMVAIPGTDPKSDEILTDEPLYTIEIYYVDGHTDVIQSTEHGDVFYRMLPETEEGAGYLYCSDISLFFSALEHAGDPRFTYDDRNATPTDIG